mmetsp:Transcript_3205/g.6524  ORF Transcript_3205/g.6524 Transcript_3205/m.6524 type:complete len:231 (-) Transcript_3205:112-804(-)
MLKSSQVAGTSLRTLSALSTAFCTSNSAATTFCFASLSFDSASFVFSCAFFTSSAAFAFAASAALCCSFALVVSDSGCVSLVISMYLFQDARVTSALFSAFSLAGSSDCASTAGRVSVSTSCIACSRVFCAFVASSVSQRAFKCFSAWQSARRMLGLKITSGRSFSLRMAGTILMKSLSSASDFSDKDSLMGVPSVLVISTWYTRTPLPSGLTSGSYSCSSTTLQLMRPK